MLDVQSRYAAPLGEKMLFTWHRMLMKGSDRVQVGKWRSHVEPMQVVSGPVGRQRVHFEAPPSAHVPAEMKAYFRWFNESVVDGKREVASPLVRSAWAR